jgi:integrase
MAKRAKRNYGSGVVEQRGPNTFRLRYAIDGKRHSKTVTGSKADAVKELRSLMKAGDDGGHVAPSKMTLGQWIADWLDSGAPGRRQEAVSQRTLERYGQLLNTHVKPVLGDRPMQQLKSTEIDASMPTLRLRRISRHGPSITSTSFSNRRSGLLTAPV